MADYKICIPSYKRADKQATLELLFCAYDKNDIIISTQDKYDFQLYDKKYGALATIIYKDGDCVGDNRNNLLEYCSNTGVKRCVMLDDDISGFLRYDNVKITDGSKVKKIIDYLINTAERAGAKLFGTYPIANSFFMNEKIVQNIIIVTCFGIMDTGIRFDRSFRIKEDYELSLRVMNNGGRVLRFNAYSPIAAHKSKGGCSDEWKNKKNEQYAYILASAYPNLCEINKTRKGEIKFKKNKC